MTEKNKEILDYINDVFENIQTVEKILAEYLGVKNTVIFDVKTKSFSAFIQDL